MAKDYNSIKVKEGLLDNNNEEVADVEERKELKSVVSAQPKKAKKGLLNRLISGVAGPEGFDGIGSYVTNDIIKPAIKNIVVDTVTSGINMLIYGDRGGRGSGGSGNYYGGRTGGTHRPYTNYGQSYSPRYNSSQQPEPSQQRTVRHHSRHGVEEYIIESRRDALEVLTQLKEQADRYDNCSVADYYELIGVDSQFTDEKYGWTIDTIMDAVVVPARGGYVIKFPPTVVI